MRYAVIPLLLAAVVGCGRSDGPKEKYFAGETVDHWLAELRSADPKKRKKAADVLGNVGPADPRAVPALTEAARDKDAKVREAVVLGLSKIGPSAAEALPILREVARADPDRRIRDEAAKAIERVEGR